ETMYIYFDSDTAFSTGSPCNAGFGQYESEQEGNIHVKSLGSTKKLCDDSRMEWENKFYEAIRKAERYLVKDKQLILLGKNMLVFQQGTPPDKPDCFDFDSVPIDANLCISEGCKIAEIINGEDSTIFLYEKNLLKTVRVKYNHPALNDRKFQFIHDNEGRPVKIEGTLMKELIWSSDGLLEEVVTYQGNFASIRQTFAYDAEGRMISYVLREHGNEFVFRKEYTYDERGNPVEEKTFNEQENLGVIRRFEYDYKTNPFKGVGFPTVYEIEPEVLPYFSTNNVVKVTEQFPGQSEGVIRRYVYTYNDACVPVRVKASFDLCSVTTVQYTYTCEP
ncbi:MAG: META domain-containing protein, partial [Clostridia bacterium]|nr:META domain-containing protein [Clostridia bacterium]